MEGAAEESKVPSLATRQPYFPPPPPFLGCQSGSVCVPCSCPPAEAASSVAGTARGWLLMWKPDLNNNSFHHGAQAAIWRWQHWVTADLVFSVSWYQLEPCQFAPVESLSLNGGDYPDFYSSAEEVAAAVLHIPNFSLGCLGLLVLSLEERVRRTSLLVLRQSLFSLFILYEEILLKYTMEWKP